MSTIPGSNAATFWSALTIFTFSGATYKALSDVTIKHGNKIVAVPTTGTTLPYFGTGQFEGSADITCIGSSDNQMWSSVSQTSGIVPTIGFTMQPQNTNATMSGQTWYMSGKATEFQMKWNGDKEVEYKLKLVLTNFPVIS
jgi:hypothetical protein